MAQLEIKNLHVSVDGKMILKGINLTIPKGQTVVLMGPNGSGKSTLANALMGHPSYKIEEGTVLLDGVDITSAEADERAKRGLLLSFQYPVEVQGVTLSNFLRTAYNNLHPEKKLGVMEFHRLLKEKMASLQMDTKFSTRYLNAGFSGGEKKKAEILQLSILQPQIALLDETDSGLDVDALRIISNGINQLKKKGTGFLLITHYQRILDKVIPDVVHVLVDGKIVKTGDKELAKEIEAEGFEEVQANAK